jgi:hypothetical protein
MPEIDIMETIDGTSVFTITARSVPAESHRIAK